MVNPFCVNTLSFSGPYFPVLELKTEIYSVNMQENTDQKKSVFGHFTQWLGPIFDRGTLCCFEKRFLISITYLKALQSDVKKIDLDFFVDWLIWKSFVLSLLNYIRFSDSSSYADEDIADLYEITKKVEMVSSKWKELARIKEKVLTYSKLTYYDFFS